MRGAALVGLFALATIAAGCGGSKERQDANEPSGEFPVEVVTAKFPTEQRLAKTVDLRLEVENSGDETVPDLAVTIYTGDEMASDPFSIVSDQPGLADPNRPVWILENGFPKLGDLGYGEKLDKAPSAGAEAAQTNTFSFGSLEPEDTVDAVWQVTPVQGGTYTVHYEIAAGLNGKAKAVTDDGTFPVQGEFVVTISDKPPRARVDGAGNVVIEGQ